MYKHYNDWLDFVNLSSDYPLAFTYKNNYNEERPVIHIKDIETLIKLIEKCEQHKIDYDFTVGLAELTIEEQDKLCKLTGVYIS